LTAWTDDVHALLLSPSLQKVQDRNTMLRYFSYSLFRIWVNIIYFSTLIDEPLWKKVRMQPEQKRIPPVGSLYEMGVLCHIRRYMLPLTGEGRQPEVSAQARALL
jgi:hypothetical protein